MKIDRKSGVLLHITSLPSKYGVGDLGVEAYRFVDQLIEHGFSTWQILPLGPNGPGNSPYQAYSAYAGDPLFISPEELFKWGLLTTDDLLRKPSFSARKCEFVKVSKWKNKLFEKAWENFLNLNDIGFKNEFNHFLFEHNWWLSDYALYQACKIKFNNEPWNKWPTNLAKRLPAELELQHLKMNEEIMFEKFKQFMFFKQWFLLKNYANQKGVQIFGDLPLYVAHDSADVWSNQEIFFLNSKGNPTIVGGVPPDYFSDDGQLWGNPVFNWEQLDKTGYQWWLSRLHFNFHLYNLVRIDHFRGLESFWAIPANSITAKHGEWMPANGQEMLAVLQSQLTSLPIVAEDLGIITPEVEQLRDGFNLPGMKVLQFAFTSDYTNEHLPHNYTNNNNIVYTGTHDNDTLLGWWNSIKKAEKKMATSLVRVDQVKIAPAFIELAWASTAKIAIVPLQDVMELDGEARMNVPGTATENWSWRYSKSQLRKKQLQFMKKLNIKYNRCNNKE